MSSAERSSRARAVAGWFLVDVHHAEDVLVRRDEVEHLLLRRLRLRGTLQAT
jgi:hypothetical protein